MKQYKVLRNNIGFHGRYWEEGKIVDLDDDDIPPHHFELVGSQNGKAEPIDDTIVDPMKPMPGMMGRPVKPIGGFASSQEFSPPKPPETAGSVMKKSPGRPKKVAV